MPLHGFRAMGYFGSFSPIVATGGSVTTYTQDGIVYKVHSFTTVGSSGFVVTDAGSLKKIDYLVVAGGGGGGPSDNEVRPGGGGGGAGGPATTTGSVTTIPGPGISIDITGTSLVYALGGTGGDGRSSGGDGPAGTDGRGHGGGGGGLNRSGLKGGSGIVVVRYIESYL